MLDSLLIPMKAQNFLNKEQILEKLELTNSYFMKKWPDVGKEIVTDKARPSNIWTVGFITKG